MKHTLEGRISTSLGVFVLMTTIGVLTFPGSTKWMVQGAQADQDAVAKVVYHVDFADPRRFSAMLTSIDNMITTYENELAEYDIRVVFNSYGIRFVTDDKLKGTPFEEDKALKARRQELLTRLRSAHEVRNVKLELCEITRTAVGLDKEKLMPGVDIVPSGVVQVAELQRKGYAYIKVE